MASDFDRDNSVDRLLKGARRDLTSAPPEEAGPACLDAETLAAWADGGLDADRVRLVETHVADCARCQAMSAAFFAADAGAAASSSTVVPFRAQRTNRLMYWLPIATATIAATLVIWMGIRGRNLPEPTSAMGDALLKETATPAPTPTGSFGQAGTQARQEAAPLPLPSKPAESKARERLDAVSPVEVRGERAKQDAKAAGNSRATAQGQGQAAQPLTRAAAPPPPPPVLTPTPKATPTPTTVTSTVGQSAAAAGVTRETVFRSTVAAQVIAEFASADPRALTINGLPGVVGGVAGAGAGGRGGGGGGGRGGGGGAAMVADASVSRPIYWRILVSDVIEKSTDRVTWEAITISPPVQGLLQGSAPAPTVCWIVGRAGLVLLSTDSRNFTRVTSPTTDDLTSVSSINALIATVRTADGRAWVTNDGGKSWK